MTVEETIKSEAHRLGFQLVGVTSPIRHLTWMC